MSPCLGGTKWQQRCPCRGGPQRAGSVLGGCPGLVSAAITTSGWSFNHLKVAPCPLPCCALCSSPHFIGHTAPDILAEQFPPLSQGMLLVLPFPTANITAGGQRAAAQPPVLWGQPGCPGSAHHPLCHPNTARHCVQPVTIPAPCPRPSGFAQYEPGNTGSSLPGWDQPPAVNPRSCEKGGLLPQPQKLGCDAADPLPAWLTQ